MTATTELQTWLNGVPTGGPNGDGRYPLTYRDGLVYLVYCPEAQALNPSLAEQPIEVFTNTATAAADTATTKAATATQAAIDAQTAAANAAAKATAAAGSATTATTQAGVATTSAAAAAATLGAVNASRDAAADSATAAATEATAAASSTSEAHAWALTAQTTVTGLLRYQEGGWDASSGVFPSNPTKGDFWKITTAGVMAGTEAAVGDQIIFGGTGWDKINNTESVTSVAGRIGNVVIAKSDIAGLQADLDARALLSGATFTGPVSATTFNMTGTAAGTGYIFSDRTSGVTAWNLYSIGGKASLFSYASGLGVLDVDSSGNVRITGSVTAANLSGTNTGDQNLSSLASIASPRLSASTAVGFDVADTAAARASAPGVQGAGGVGAGGAMLFGAGSTNFAYMKGYFTNGSTNGVGKLVFGTRTAIGDTSMTNKLVLHENGDLDVVAGSATVANSLTVNCTNASDVLVVNRPGSSPAGSYIQFSSPGAIPGIIGNYAGNYRTDLKFNSGGSFSIAVSATSGGAGDQFNFTSAGNFTATGAISAASYGGAGVSQEPSGGTLVQRTTAGYIKCNYINTPANDIGSVTPSHIAVQTASDGYLRWQSPAGFRAVMKTPATFVQSADPGAQPDGTLWFW